jgi:hypothetical protein
VFDWFSFSQIGFQFNVNSTGAKNRSARGARGTIFRHLDRAERGPNGEIKLTQILHLSHLPFARSARER